MKERPNEFRSGVKATVIYKTEYMSEPLADKGRLHVEPTGEWWLSHWKNESCDIADLIHFETIQ